MASVYDPNVIEAGPWDVAEIIARYGPVGPFVPTPPNPAPFPHSGGAFMEFLEKIGQWSTELGAKEREMLLRAIVCYNMEHVAGVSIRTNP